MIVMRSRLLICLAALTIVTSSASQPVRTAGPAARKPLDANERSAMLALLAATDSAQSRDTNTVAFTVTSGVR